MGLMHKHCAAPGCAAPVGWARCQDCGKPFCPGHVAAVDFSGFRRGATAESAWTRFVCAGCAGRANRSLLDARTAAAHAPAGRTSDERVAARPRGVG